MTTRCLEDGELFDDDRGMCETYVCATDPVVVAGQTAQASPAVEPGRCAGRRWTGTGVVDGSGLLAVQEAVAELHNTECLNPECRRALTSPALYIKFRDGEVELARGEQAELGRHGPHARLFRAYPNVSRRHGVVGVETDGRAFLESLPTPNGTFVNGSGDHAARQPGAVHGRCCRFALNVEGTVTLYDR
jgi:hypothetical protein